MEAVPVVHLSTTLDYCYHHLHHHRCIIARDSVQTFTLWVICEGLHHRARYGPCFDIGQGTGLIVVRTHINPNPSSLSRSDSRAAFTMIQMALYIETLTLHNRNILVRHQQKSVTTGKN